MHSSMLMPVRHMKMLKKYSKTNPLRYANIRHVFSISTEYDDIYSGMRPTKFDYPEQKIHVSDEKRILDVWKLEMQHYLKFIKNPRENRLLRDVLPRNFDIVVIGGGFIGSSLAYWLRERHRDNQSILIIDKDLKLDRNINDENPEQISAFLGIGNIRQQFSLKENIGLAKASADFFRNMSERISHTKQSFPSVPYKPFGFLNLATAEGEESLRECHMLQQSLNVENELLTPFQLAARFPWLNVNDIKLGCHGLENEGWIDPYVYMLTMRNAAISLGTVFMEAEPVEFIYGKTALPRMRGYEPFSYRPVNDLIFKLPDGSYQTVTFGTCILALGSETGTFTKQLLHLDEKNPGLFGLEIPIERRKRYIFSFEAPDGGVELSAPLVVDPTGLFVHRTGVTDYICGMAPIAAEEPSTDNLDVDYDFFYKRIWPLLAKRIPLFEHLRLKSGYAYYTDYNTFDGNGIIGRIPAYGNIYVAAGFGENAVQFSPIIGKAMMELLYDDDFITLPLYELSYKRILLDYDLEERISLS